MTVVRSSFRPAPWLRNPHLQTLWPVWFRRPRIVYRRERLELPDGDFLDLDWGPLRNGPLVVIFHGLEGSSRSHYAAGLMAALSRAGLQGVVMHFRGCSGEPNRRARRYTAGETDDPAHVLTHLARRFPGRDLHAVGYSLGGNALLRLLGEDRPTVAIHSAVAVSVPFDLALCARRLRRGLSRMYDRYLVTRLRRNLALQAARPGFPIPAERIRACRDLRGFDDQVTAPLHGFRDADHYYRSASARPILARIRVPTLLLHARDDPFMFPEVMPQANELGPHTRLEWSPHGGHVGFVEAPGRYWLERRIVRWLQTDHDAPR